MRISDGSLEALKWLALASMTADHINKYLLNASEPYLFNFGRLALPLFVFVFAANLARPGVLESGAYVRTARRLGLSFVLACVPFVALGGLVAGWYPLNVLATLLVLDGVLYGLDRGDPVHVIAAAVLFAIGGGMVEFWWPALGLGVGAWLYHRHRTAFGILIAITSCACLTIINGNWWAMAAFACIALAYIVPLRIPRLRWLFYAYYPAHLTLIWLIRIPLARSGYILNL